MNTKIKQIYTKPVFIILFLLACASFIGSIILIVFNQRQQIKPNSLPKPSFNSDVHLNLKYSFNGELPQLDTEVSVFQQSNDKEAITDQKVASYGSVWGFGENFQFLPGLKSNAYLFTKSSEELIITTNPNVIEYANYKQAGTNKIADDKYKENAKSFLLQKKLLPKSLELDQGYFQPMMLDPQGITIPTKNKNETKYIQISFNYLLEQKPLLDKQSRDFPVVILLNLDGSIRKATILIPISSVTSIGKINITSPLEALTAINNGQGTFTTLSNQNLAYTELKTGELNTSIFNSVEIVYIYDYDTGSIQPYYRFTGYGYTRNGDKINVGVIITALPQDLYK